MYIDMNTRGSETLLIALDGLPIGGVVEADTAVGYVVRYKRATVETERVEGAVDFVGDTSTDPDWMIAQRLAAIRQRLKLPPAEVPPLLSEGTPLILEQLAARLRLGEAEVLSVGCSCPARSFPDGALRPTGRVELRITYDLVATRSEFQEFEARWCRLNPDLVPEYVRSVSDEEHIEKRTP